MLEKDDRFLQLNVKKDEKGKITMCTILDAAITQGETLKLIVQVQKKIKKGKNMAIIADDLEEDKITISPIYKIAKEYPNDTEKDIYRKLINNNKVY